VHGCQGFELLTSNFDSPVVYARGCRHSTRVLAVLQRRPSIIQPGGLEGEGFESGLLKMGIERGFLK